MLMNVKRSILVILSMLMLAGCSKVKDNNNENSPTPGIKQPTLGVTISPSAPTTAPTSPTVSPTETVTKPTDDGTNNGEETSVIDNDADKEDIMSKESALSILRGYISESVYEIELMKEEVIIDGSSYYLYKVSKDKDMINPFIAIRKSDASVYYYDNDELIDFNGFPLDKSEVIEPDDNMEINDAIDKLSNLSHEKLKLKKALNEYEIEMDTWTTVVNGEQCYGINLFDVTGERQLAAIFYISVDGSVIYHLEDDYSFIKISE